MPDHGFTETRPGGGVLSRDLNEMGMTINQLANLTVAPPLELIRQGTGLHVRIKPGERMWGQITGVPTNGLYPWKQVVPTNLTNTNTFTSPANAFVGQTTPTNYFPAEEINGDNNVPVNSYVQVWMAETGDHFIFLEPGSVVPPGDCCTKGYGNGRYGSSCTACWNYSGATYCFNVDASGHLSLIGFQTSSGTSGAITDSSTACPCNKTVIADSLYNPAPVLGQRWDIPCGVPNPTILPGPGGPPPTGVFGLGGPPPPIPNPLPNPNPGPWPGGIVPPPNKIGPPPIVKIIPPPLPFPNPSPGPLPNPLPGPNPIWPPPNPGPNPLPGPVGFWDQGTYTLLNGTDYGTPYGGGLVYGSPILPIADVNPSGGASVGVGGSGVIQSTGWLATQTGNVNLTSFTVGASDGTFSVHSNTNITVGGTLGTTVALQVTYTDPNNNAVTTTLVGTSSSGLNSVTTNSAVDNYTYQPFHIRAKASTVITVKAVKAGGGTITFDAGGTIVQLA